MKSKVSKFANNRSEVLVSDEMSGKMFGIPCISTIYLCNERCKQRMENPEYVCNDCYVKQHTYKKSLVENCMQNYELMNSRLLELDEFPKFMFDSIPVRIESYGDTGSVLHAKNYVGCCNANPNIQFSAWTKNPDHWDEAFKELGKPKNLIMLISSVEYNKPTPLASKYSWVDHVFTVYTLEYLMEHPEVKINCGFNVCRQCMNCYGKENSEFYVNEILKKDAKKYLKWLETQYK